MAEKEETVGYYTEDGEIYCVECINKNSGVMKKIERAITGEDPGEGLYFCDGCKKEIKQAEMEVPFGKVMAGMVGQETNRKKMGS